MLRIGLALMLSICTRWEGCQCDSVDQQGVPAPRLPGPNIRLQQVRHHLDRAKGLHGIEDRGVALDFAIPPTSTKFQSDPRKNNPTPSTSDHFIGVYQMGEV